MADAPELPESSRIAQYVERLIAGDFDGKTKQEIAADLDINRKTLWHWNRKVDWEYISAERRKLYKQDVLEIDQAMLREGKKGNVAAAELAYRRFDGWVPTTAQVNLDAPDDELKRLASQIKAELLGDTPASASVPTNPAGGPQCPS